MRRRNLSTDAEIQEEARTQLKARHAQKSWAAVSDELGGINRGILSGVANGKRRAGPSLLKALDLPVTKFARAPACPYCNAPPHPHRNCPARANGHGKPHLPGVSLSDNPAVTARSIRRHKGGDYIRALWEHERAKAWALGETGLLWR